MSRLSPGSRRVLIRLLYVVVEAGLIAGAFVDPIYWQWVVWFSIFHAALFLVLFGFKPMVFPTQLRLVYVAWVAIGTFVPQMTWMMYVTMVGLGANLLFGWCPLSRMIYLFPWNRQTPLTPQLFMRTFFSGPQPGRFKVIAAPASGA
ncbi:MAG: hypothetical protein DRH23_17860 [Deltaproteobacteria bacterium]|nr:MAG: hypothetical protein DRH23_17860 [Deltaproteobacteria bacterium]